MVLRPDFVRLQVVTLILLLALGGPASGEDIEPVRVLIVDSYHQGYPWSDDVRRAIYDVLDVDEIVSGRGQGRDGRLSCWVEFMDTKRRPDPAWAEQAASRIAGVVVSWHPDIIITSDDNAVRYLVLPYLLGQETPVVYCGLNYGASVYGLPVGNVTGMIEVEQIRELRDALRSVAQGDRFGFLVLDSTTGRRDVEALRQDPMLDPVVRLVPDYAAWKQSYREMQDQVDMLFIKQNIAGVPDWDLDDAIAFTRAETRIPVGTTGEPVMACALVSFIKSGAEQGRWAAETALRILDGTSPEAIEPGINRESRVYLNMTLARILDLRFPMELIDRATFLEERWSP